MIEKISKLPLWARQLISTLEQDVLFYKSAYQEISRGESAIRCTDSVNPPIGLPSRNTIEMDVKGGVIELTLRNGVLEIRADKAILIQSSAGNVLKAWVSE